MYVIKSISEPVVWKHFNKEKYWAQQQRFICNLPAYIGIGVSWDVGVGVDAGVSEV